MRMMEMTIKIIKHGVRSGDLRPFTVLLFMVCIIFSLNSLAYVSYIVSSFLIFDMYNLEYYFTIQYNNILRDQGFPKRPKTSINLYAVRKPRMMYIYLTVRSTDLIERFNSSNLVRWILCILLDRDIQGTHFYKTDMPVSYSYGCSLLCKIDIHLGGIHHNSSLF